MDKFVAFFKIAAVILLVLGCVVPPSFAGHGDDDDFDLMGFDAGTYLQINPFLEKQYITDTQLGNTAFVRDGKLVPKMRDDLYLWLTNYARESIKDDAIECLPWVYGSKTFGVKAFAQIHPQLHDQFRASFFPKGVIRKGLTPNKYKAFFTRYLQDCLLIAPLSSSVILKDLTDAIPEPAAYTPRNPWCTWNDVVIEEADSGKGNGKDSKTLKYGSIGSGVHKSYFAAKGTDSHTSEENFDQILRWREGLQTPKMTATAESSVVRAFEIDPHTSLVTKPNPAEINEHEGLREILKGHNLGDFQNFRLFENYGEGLCGFHGLGVDPSYFVNECIRRLGEGTNEEIEAVFAHVYFDLKSMRTRQREQHAEFAEYEAIFESLFGTENISGLSDEDLIKLLFNEDNVREQITAESFIRDIKARKVLDADKFKNPLRDIEPDSIEPHIAMKNTAIRLFLDLKPCINNDVISNYLRARYTGLNEFKSLINNGYIEADNLNLIAQIGGVGFVTITERPPGAKRIHKDRFVTCCDEVLFSDSSDYKDQFIQILVQFIWDIRSFEEEILANAHYGNIQFENTAKAKSALEKVFGTKDIITKFQTRRDAEDWLRESPDNPMKFVRARFESNDIRFAKVVDDGLDLAYDPLVQNEDWIIVEDWRAPPLGVDRTHPYLEIFNRVDYRIQGDFTSGRIVFLYLNGIHYSTLLPIGAEYDTFGESKYALQMVLEDLSTHAKSGYITSDSMDEYIRKLKTIYPEDEIDLALTGRVHPKAINLKTESDKVKALATKIGISEVEARKLML